MDEKELALFFHETYERFAPQFGYETRTETRAFDENSPNGRLMIAVCREILRYLLERPTRPDEAELYRCLKCGDRILHPGHCYNPHCPDRRR